jgi:hypothetical protein
VQPEAAESAESTEEVQPEVAESAESPTESEGVAEEHAAESDVEVVTPVVEEPEADSPKTEEDEEMKDEVPSEAN